VIRYTIRHIIQRVAANSANQGDQETGNSTQNNVINNLLGGANMSRVVVPPNRARNEVVLNIQGGETMTQEELQMLANIIGGQEKGFSNQLIDELKTTEFDAETHLNSECAICYKDFEEKQEVYKLPCNHSFDVCIKKWFKMSKRCPLCNRVFKHTEL